MALTISQKTSEEEEVNQASAEAAAFRALRTKVESLVDFILGKRNLHTQLKNISRKMDVLLPRFTCIEVAGIDYTAATYHPAIQ